MWLYIIKYSTNSELKRKRLEKIQYSTVRVNECFKCEVTEKDVKIGYALDKPVLCEKYSKKEPKI